jgi:hypothetical protein
MSHSYRKTMVHGHTTSGSEKDDKRIYNRALRSRVRQNLRTCDDFEALVLPEVSDVSNPWSMAKDGKTYSKWLEGYRNTLVKVHRTRDGHDRYLLTITESTFAHHAAYTANRRFRSIWGFFLDVEETEPCYRDFAHAMEIIRK